MGAQSSRSVGTRLELVFRDMGGNRIFVDNPPLLVESNGATDKLRKRNQSRIEYVEFGFR